jgi:hypothetical protein
MGSRIILMLTGAVAFWVPAVLLEVLSEGKFTIAIANIVPVVCSLCFYWLLRRGAHFRKLKSLPLYTLAGIYLLCPLSTTIAGSAFGGGFARFAAGGHDVLWLAIASFVPPLAMALAGYNGTVFGLLAITIILIAEAIRRSAPAEPDLYPAKSSRQRP